MLDFFLVLGQIPGTHFYLTFTELFWTYSLCLISYILRREYILATTFLIEQRLNYVMYSTRVRPGRVKQRVLLPDHIDLTLRVDIDFDRYLRVLRQFRTLYLIR
jgi:hypothetical protein